jgi:hypothetical protein
MTGLSSLDAQRWKAEGSSVVVVAVGPGGGLPDFFPGMVEADPDGYRRDRSGGLLRRGQRWAGGVGSGWWSRS